MANSLIIVESPAKVKTIAKFLGKNYTIDATMGHLIDMPKSSLGVDVDNDYEPKYITIRGKGELLSKLKREAKKADRIYLATDPDREGEAISWHLNNELCKDKNNEKKISRISFNEITKNAVKNALKNPRMIDMDLVNAQQARRVMDRLVGYTISPLLWRKIRKGLSAGRVQSVALKMISDREAEIAAFVPEEYWSLNAELLLGKKKLTAAFYGQEKRMPLPRETDADAVIAAISDADFLVSEIRKSKRQKRAPLPFTTSTLQQEAAKLLSFPTQKTMRIAQSLYEGVHVAGHGTVGLITYLRTDSTRIAEEADTAAREYIEKKYGAAYVSKAPRTQAQNETKIQDAHEAIRPTYLDITPSEAKESLGRDEFRLYQLIYKRFLASRMESAVYDTESVRLRAGDYVFTLNGSKLVFDGFLSVYMSEEDREEKNVELPDMEVGDRLRQQRFEKEQHFTQPPAHYTEASLVKALEEVGIGRPSTYAPTIGTLLLRRYVTKEKKNLFVTELGIAVNEMMSQNFPTIIDTGFTANMESLLDSVAEGRMGWKVIIENFYPDLAEAVERANREVEKVTIRDEESDVLCDKCGRRMVVKYGPHGKFLACPGFPECKNTKPYIEYAGFVCPDCGAECVKRRSKKGRIFYSCSRYPECSYITWTKPKDAKAGTKQENEIVEIDLFGGEKREPAPEDTH
ncbi:type I DNA topoisomerase [Oribacterium sp. oral taxon 102]|uniref:type I DNA topoisomerase n=1 Tax=Oribacterium sp. oral taxon 102 TaxID=671214 RepID=UPI0015BDBA06|nr:type I DNA topoisomerase [Oribacterium sp. oral taxon 102]NWO21586.1 type I DNA topoisomerase [Oribacterium sp. oral taxon 102]